MRTSVATLALVLQVAVAVPASGNGPQLVQLWKESDNGISGDVLNQLQKPLSWQDKFRLENILDDDYDSREANYKHLSADYPESGEDNVEGNGQLRAPRPTPRPPTEQDEEDYRKSEKLQRENSLKAEDVKSKTGFRNLATNNIYKSIPEKSENVKTIDTAINNDPADELSSPLVEEEHRREEIAEILKTLAILLKDMTPSEKTDFYGALEQLLREHIKEKTPENNNDLKKSTSKVTVTVTSRPCDQDEGSSQESSSQEQSTDIRFSRVQETPTKVPTFKGVLIKSLVPKEYFVAKDIYDIMKAKAAANAARECEDNPCLPEDPSSPEEEPAVSFPKNPSRYAIYVPTNRNMVAPKYFPGFHDQGTQTDREEYNLPNFMGHFRLPSSEGMQDRIQKQSPLNSMTHVSQATQRLRFENSNFDPEFLGFIKNILTKLNDQSFQLSRLGDPQISAVGDMMPGKSDDRREFNPIQFRQRKMYFG